MKNRIADDNKITVEADEVRAEAKDLIISKFGGHALCRTSSATSSTLLPTTFSKNENGQNFMKLYNQLRSEKILKYIREHITVQEKKVTVDEFKKIVEEHKH